MAQANDTQGDSHKERDGDEIALERIAAEREARTGKLDLGGLGLSRLPEELFELEWLDVLRLGGAEGIEDKRGGGTRTGLDATDSPRRPNQIQAGIQRISRLPNLRELDCSTTDLADLSAIATCRDLVVLKCGGTPLQDLEPLAGLLALTSLHCSSTWVSDLAPLAGLSALTSLDCSWTQVSDLAPLAGLRALTSLKCAGCQVSELAPLAGVSARAISAVSKPLKANAAFGCGAFVYPSAWRGIND